MPREGRPADYGPRPKCRECGKSLGAGYICDDCDRLEVLSDDD